MNEDSVVEAVKEYFRRGMLGRVELMVMQGEKVIGSGGAL